MITVTLYTRSECSLCEQAKIDLASIQSQIPHQLVEVDVDISPELQRKYFDQVPVVEVLPYRLKAPFSRPELLMTLGAARDAGGQKARLAQAYPSQPATRADKFSLWITNHWLALVNLLFFLYVALPFLAPVLMKANNTVPANIIYTAYSPLCHQLGFRSFFLFGEQPYYPRAAAGVPGVVTFGQATGLSEDNDGLLAARSFIGNDQLGYKVALCERDVAIYAAIVIFGLLFALTGRRMRPLHWAWWLFLAFVPIGLDGFSQLFSQLGLPAINAILPYRESSPLLRVLTGFLFGFTTAWFGLPYMEESMRESRELLVRRFPSMEKK